MNDKKCMTESCIGCSVSSCVYHEEGDRCTAGEIQVGHRNASSTQETCCDTFKLKS